MVHRSGISNDAIEDHEEAAEVSLILVEILGALTLGAWLFERLKRPAPSAIWWGIFAFGIAILVFFVRTAHLGGLIRHDEIKVSTSILAAMSYS